MPSNAVTRVTLTGPHTQVVEGVTHTFDAGRHFLPEHVADAARAAGLVDDGETLAAAVPAPPPAPKPKRVRKRAVRAAKAPPAEPPTD